MTAITVCQHQGLFHTAVLKQINHQHGHYPYQVELIPHDEIRWANKQTVPYQKLDDAIDGFQTAVKNIMTSDRAIAINIPGEFERVQKEREEEWQEEDRTTGQLVRDALQAQLNQQ